MGTPPSTPILLRHHLPLKPAAVCHAAMISAQCSACAHEATRRPERPEATDASKGEERASMAPPRDAFSLPGKLALVSGGSSGTGRAVAIIPAARSGSAEVGHRSGRDRAAEVAGKIAQDRAWVITVPADVTNSAAVERCSPRAANDPAGGRSCQQSRRWRPAMSLLHAGR
jgi:hypothetical protein